jgi:DNA 3'-phosphatase
VATKVLKERGLDGHVTPKQLADAAATHDLHNEGYVSRDELELAAGDLAKTVLGDTGDEVRSGLTYPRALLDAAKARLNEIGVYVTDADMRRALERIDDGDAKLSPAEIEHAAAAVVEVARLERVSTITAPARPGIAAQTTDAIDSLARRKLADTFSYSGSGKVKVAFFDADSTLRVSASGSVSANGPTDVRLLPFVADKLKELADDGWLIAVVSNQAGVQYGHVKIEDADAALQHTADLIRAAGGEVHYTDFAEQNGPDRKPNPGMADRLQTLLKSHLGDEADIDLTTSIMVGDSAYKRGHDTRPDGGAGTNFSNSDRKFAEAAGVTFVEPDEAFGWDRYDVPQFDDHNHLDSFFDRFRVGRHAADGPLFARFKQD